eukprot:2521538-Pyramimonas_sp.AAC.1
MLKHGSEWGVHGSGGGTSGSRRGHVQLASMLASCAAVHGRTADEHGDEYCECYDDVATYPPIVTIM